MSARLEARRSEIERAALTRVYSVDDPRTGTNPEYVDGLRSAVFAAIEYGLAGIASGVEGLPRVPPVLLEQARLAARNDISLDTVLRRYVAGYTVLGDFVIEEARSDEALPGTTLQQVMRGQATLFDRLIAVITAEYRHELEGRALSGHARLAERVRRLLAGELLDTAELAYDFEAWHLGVLGVGPKADEAIRRLAKGLERRLLLVPTEGETVWAWLGGRRPPDLCELERSLDLIRPAQISLAVGEPAQGIGGWRLTHLQARAAFPIALRRSDSVTRYSEVALLASMLQDDLLVTSLHELYLAPLDNGRGGGETARETLRAYFAAERNVSSAAAAIGVNRRTVANRLQAIEATLGCSLRTAGPRIEAALNLHDLGSAAVDFAAETETPASPT